MSLSLSLQYKRTLKDCSFFSTPQQTSGVDLALLLVDTLQKSGFSVSQEYIGKESSSIVGLMYISAAPTPVSAMTLQLILPVVYSNIRLQPHIDQQHQHWSYTGTWNRTTRNNRCHPCPAKGEVWKLLHRIIQSICSRFLPVWIHQCWKTDSYGSFAIPNQPR